MSILIFSENGDAHAATVEAALANFDVDCIKLCADNYPTQHEITFAINNGQSCLNIKNDTVSCIDTVWLRRRGIPNSVPNGIEKEDQPIALQESKEFWKAFLMASFQDARWVNPIFAKLRAQSKISQLQIARTVGFTIPKSLFSNDAGQIRNFVRHIGKCIFKSFSPVSWKEDDAFQALYTSKIEESDLPFDLALQAAPGIYQQAIDKQFEVRATFFGQQCIAAKLSATSRGAEPQDWRLGYYGSLRVEPYILPKKIHDIAIKFMKEMNLEYAAFDFIFSTDGQWYFIEINEAGQFLWIEQFNPEISLLKPFCDFLVGDTKWSPQFSLAQIDSNMKLREPFNIQK